MAKGLPEQSWFFPVYSGLLHNTHKRKIGDAIWLFLWCIDKTTLEEDDPDDPEEKIGWVLQKKPVTTEQIAKQFGESWRTTQRHLEILRSQKYITVTRARRGIIIGVLKSKKWTGRKSNITSEERVILNFLKGISKYPYNYQTDLEFLRTLWVDFPGIKILEELKKWKVWLMDARVRLRGKVNYRSRFRNWLKIAEQKRRIDAVQEEKEAESSKRLMERYKRHEKEAAPPERVKDLIKGVSKKLGPKKG